MKKLIALLLSFSILFMSAAPSYAEALSRQANTEATIGSAIDGAARRAARTNGKARYGELKEVIDELLITQSGDYSLHNIYLQVGEPGQAGGYSSVELSMIDPDNETDVNAGFGEVFGQALDGEDQEVYDDLVLFETFRTWYDREHDANLVKVLSGMENDEETDAFYQREGVLFNRYRLADAAGYAQDVKTATETVQRNLKRNFRQDLIGPMLEDDESIEDYMRQLVKVVWEEYYKKRNSTDAEVQERLEYLTLEGMPLFKTAGLLDAQTENEVGEEVRRLLKAYGGFCAQTESGEEECRKGLKALLALGIFGKAATRGHREDVKLIGDVMKYGYEGLGGAAVLDVGAGALVELNGGSELADGLMFMGTPNRFRESWELKEIYRDFSIFMKDGKGGWVNPYGAGLRIAAEERQDELEGESFNRNMWNANYEEDGEVGNVFFDIGKDLAQLSKEGNATAKYVVERIMRYNLHYRWNDWGANAELYPQMIFKMFAAGALVGGYDVNIKVGDNYGTRFGMKTVTDEYGWKWEPEQFWKWHEADKYRMENWACGRAYERSNPGLTWNAGLSQRGFILYGLLQNLKTDKLINGKQRAWLERELATAYNGELAKCDRQLNALSDAQREADVAKFAVLHKPGKGWKMPTPEDVIQYEQEYQTHMDNLDEFVKYMGTAALITDLAIILKSIPSLLKLGINVVRGVEAGWFSIRLFIKEARSIQGVTQGSVALRQFAKIKEVIKARRVLKFGTTSWSSVMKGKMQFHIRALGLEMIPQGLRTGKEAEVLRQMSRGYVHYLRSADAVERGIAVSSAIPESFWHQGWTMAADRIPTMDELVARRGAAGRRAYAQDHGYMELGPKEASRSSAQQELIDLLSRDGKLVEYEGYYYTSKNTRIPKDLAQRLGLTIDPATGNATATTTGVHNGQTVDLFGQRVEPGQAGQVWETIGKNEAVVHSTSAQGLPGEPASSTGALDNYYPQPWELNEFNPRHVAMAENIIGNNPGTRSFWTPERLGRWDKFTFGLTSKAVNWKMPAWLRRGAATVLTAGSLFVADPAVTPQLYDIGVPQYQVVMLDPLRVERGAYSVAPMLGGGTTTGPNVYKLAGQLAMQEAALPRQFNSFQNYMGLQRDFSLGMETVRMGALRGGYTPGMANFQAGLYPFTHPVAATQLAFSPLLLRNNPFYQGYQNSIVAAATAAASSAKPNPAEILKDVVSVDQMPGHGAVFEAKLADGSKVYIKYTDVSERDRLLAVDRLYHELDIANKYPAVNFHYQKLLSDNLDDLPDAIEDQILNIVFDEQRPVNAGLQERGTGIFIITEALDLRGDTLDDIRERMEETGYYSSFSTPFLKDLRGIVMDYAKAGMVFYDLDGNGVFNRKNNSVTFFDFELRNERRSEHPLDLIMPDDLKIGWLEPGTGIDIGRQVTPSNVQHITFSQPAWNATQNYAFNLYSGVPVFDILNNMKRLWNNVKRSAAYLHELMAEDGTETTGKTSVTEPAAEAVDPLALPADLIPGDEELDSYMAPVSKFLKQYGINSIEDYLNILHPNKGKPVTVEGMAPKNPTATTYVNNFPDDPNKPVIITYGKDLVTRLEAPIPEEVRGNSQRKRTAILYFSDLHGIDPTNLFKLYGQLVKEFGRDNLLVLSGGDIFVGDAVLNTFPVLGWMLFSILDGFVIGNHEFDSWPAFSSNILATKREGFISSDIESRAGSGVTVLAGAIRMMRGQLDTHAFSVKTMGNGDRFMLIGIPKPGYGSKLYDGSDDNVDAVQDFKESLKEAFDYALEHPVDHVLITEHDALNDWRTDKRGQIIADYIEQYFATALKNARTDADKMKVQKLHDMIRIVFEGHSHIAEQNVTYNILHLQGAGNGQTVNAVPVTIFDRVPGSSTYVSTAMVDISSDKSYETEDGLVASLYEDLYKEAVASLPGLDETFVRFVRPLRRVQDLTDAGLRHIFVDSSVSNALADVFRKRIKDMKKRDLQGKRHIPYFSKRDLFGWATPENGGKTAYENAFTLRNASKHYASNEPLALAMIKGDKLRKFIEFNMRIDKDGNIVPLGSFSHNLRVTFDSKDMTVEEIDGVKFARFKRLEVYVLNPEDNKYYPLDASPDKVYYLALPHHLAVGYYEGKGVQNFLERGFLYKEQEFSYIKLMMEYLPKVARERLTKSQTAPRPFYDRFLPDKGDPNAIDNPEKVPVFILDEGRFFDLNYLREIYGVEVSKAQLDALYNNQATLEDFFGPLADPAGRTSWLPGPQRLFEPVYA